MTCTSPSKLAALPLAEMNANSLKEQASPPRRKVQDENNDIFVELPTARHDTGSEVAALRKQLAEERHLRQCEQADHGKELANLQREAMSRDAEMARLKLQLQVEQQRAQEMQNTVTVLTSVLEEQRKKEAAAHSKAERLEERMESTLRAAEAVSAGARLQEPSYVPSKDALQARAERAEAALIATEAALSVFKSGYRHSTLLDEAESQQLLLRLERAEALNSALEKRLVAKTSRCEDKHSQDKPGVKQTVDRDDGKGLRQPTTPKAACRAPEVTSPPSGNAVTTTFGTPCGGSEENATYSPSKLARPTWDGQYLSSPKRKKHEGHALDEQVPDAGGASSSGDHAGQESETEDDGLPPPPSSRCWDWPLSRPEKQERVAMMDAQILLYEQRGLVDEVQELRDVCAQHGLAPRPAEAYE